MWGKTLMGHFLKWGPLGRQWFRQKIRVLFWSRSLRCSCGKCWVDGCVTKTGVSYAVKAGDGGDISSWKMLFRAVGLDGISWGKQTVRKEKKVQNRLFMTPCMKCGFFMATRGCSKWHREGVVSTVGGKWEEYNFPEAKERYRFQQWV